MEVQTYVLPIVNSQGKLPQNFFSLYKAAKIDATGWSSEEETLEEALLPNTFYRIRKESSKTWDNMSHAFIEGDYTEVVEKVYIGGKKVDFHYGNQQVLKLVQGYDKSKVDSKCENLHIKSSPYEISIINTTLQTNFSSGYIYLWYQGLSVDEDGEIILPEDPNARIYEFLLYSGKAKVFEMLWNNNDDPNTQAKLQYNIQQKEKARVEASTQVRFKSVSGDNWWHGLKGKQRKRIRLYENFSLGK